MPAVLRTLVTLSAGQAAGTDPVLSTNPNRTSLVAGNPTATNGRLDVAAVGAGEGLPFAAGAVLPFGGEGGRPYGGGGPACPTQAIYVGGFAENDKLTFWES